MDDDVGADQGETVKGKAEATEGTGTSSWKSLPTFATKELVLFCLTAVSSLVLFKLLLQTLITRPLKEPVLFCLKAVSSLTSLKLLLQTLTGTVILMLIQSSYQFSNVCAFMVIVPSVIYLAATHGVPWNLFFFGTLGVTALSTVGQRCLVDVGKSEGVVHRIGLLETVLINEKGSEDTVRNSHCFQNDRKKFTNAWRTIKIAIPFKIGHIDEANEVMKAIVRTLKTNLEGKVKENIICRLSKIDGLMFEFILMYSFINLHEIAGQIFEDESELILQLYKELEGRVSNAEKLQIQPSTDSY